MLFYQLSVVALYAIIGVFKIKQAGYFVPVISNFKENIYLVTSMCYLGLAGAYLSKTLYYQGFKKIGVVPVTLLFTLFLVGLVTAVHLGHTVYRKENKEV